MTNVLKVLENGAVKALALSSSAAATALELSIGVDAWLGRLGVLSTFFSATAVGIYHIWKLFHERRQAKKDQ